MAVDRNKAVVRRFFEAFGADDEVALREVLAPDLVAYSHGTPDAQNREVHLANVRMWNTAFTTQFTVQDQIAEGDKVATLVTMRAIHDRGDFQGLAPTGRQIESSGISIERFEHGKIVERRVSGDWLGIMQQLGLVQPAQLIRG